MHHFFVGKEQISDGKIVILGEDTRHIGQVLRMKIGEEILVTAGEEWEYTCSIEEINKDEVVVKILDAQKPGRELPSAISLYQCLPKSDKMELIIQKAVELGAYEVIPVASSRCVMKLDEKKAANKVKRWNAISVAAAKQSKRMHVPEVQKPIRFKDALQRAADTDVKLIPYECAEGMEGTRELLNGIKAGQSVAVLIGPEGGFDPAEVEEAVKSGFEAITLGGRILRTETAGMTVLSILMYLLDGE